jgi:hypothetical protein
MEESLEESVSESNELQVAMEQLKIQKNIHKCLSQKVVHMELEKTAMNQELETAKNDLIKEKNISNQLRDELIEKNFDCTQFFTNYQEKLEVLNLDLSWLFLGYEENVNVSPPKSLINRQATTRKSQRFSTIEEISETNGNDSNKEN